MATHKVSELKSKLGNVKMRKEYALEQKKAAENKNDKTYWETRYNELNQQAKGLEYAIKRAGSNDTVEVPSSLM